MILQGGVDMSDNNFTIGVEKLVNPMDVGALHFIQSFNNFIPKKIQRKMVDSSANVTPYMGFVVEPYSFFLGYEIADLEKASTFLPEDFELAKTRIFQEDEPKYYGIFGCFNAHTSGFWGMRVECYLIAMHKKTGLLSWVIVDYDTNTITYDPKNALSDPNAIGSVITIDYNGQLTVDVKNKEGRALALNCNIKEGKSLALDKRLWIEGNLSIAYGHNKVEEDPGVFSLIFDPLEFREALRIPHEALQLKTNNWFPGLFKDMPSEIVCFPYAQHFLSDSPGHSTSIKDEKDLVGLIKQVDFSKINVFSTKSFKLSFLIGGLISVVSNLTLIYLLLK